MIKYLIGGFLFFLIQCPFKIESLILDESMIGQLDEKVYPLTNSNCSSNLSFIPDSILTNAEIQRKIRVNFHFMNNLAGNLNYNEDLGRKYAEELIYYANRKLIYNKKMNLPEGNNTPNYNPLYQYELTSTNGKKDIYFHYDDELSYYVNEGARNNYGREVINKYEVGEDSILNIFYMIHHPDSLRSRSYSGSSAGIALGKSIKLGTKYNPKDKPWKYASLLNHEVGHVLGLSHTWNINDGCDDTPKNDNCWAPSEHEPCNGIISNNMMDYNSNQHAITPCQISKVRRNMARIGSKQRDLLVKDWCQIEPEHDVFIENNINFTAGKDLKGNVVILNGGKLTISCRLSVPEASEIVVHPEGTLILDNARIHNDCGLNWQGIRVLKKGKKMGKVYIKGNPVIENLDLDVQRLDFLQKS